MTEPGRGPCEDPGCGTCRFTGRVSSPAAWAVVYESDLQGEVYWQVFLSERKAQRRMHLLAFCNLRSLHWRVQPLTATTPDQEVQP